MAGTIRTEQILDSNGNPFDLRYMKNTGKVTNVYNLQLQTPFTCTSTSYVDITGATLTVYPKHRSSSFIISFIVHWFGNGAAQDWTSCRFGLLRDGITLRADDDYGLGNYEGDANERISINGMYSYIDSPNTLLPVIYKLQVRNRDNTTATYINTYGGGSLTIVELLGDPEND